MTLTTISSRATRYRKLAAFFVILGVSYGQSTTSGDVAGVVQDPSQAAVPNAMVTLRDTDTGATRSTTTNGQGEYRFTFMKPGPYTISASSAGLQTDISQIEVLVGQAINVTLVAKVQSTASSVEVVGVASLVDVQSPNLGATISTHDIENMPTPGGDITSVVLTTPGVAASTGSGYGNFSVHGLPGTSNLFTVNGNDYNDAYLNLNNSGASNLLLGANEIQEATIVLNPYSVQYGRQAGAQIDYTTKSGTNKFHGNLLWNWNGNILNANTFFNNADLVGTPRSVSNQYAASIGGPIKKNKLFFFADTEGIRYALPTTGYVTIPSAQLQTYALDNVTGAQAAFYQKAFQYWNNAPGASTGIPVINGLGNLQDSTGAMGCGDLAGTAAPNGGVFGTNVSCATAWAANGANLNTEWLLTTRVDYNINDKHKLSFRFKGDHGLQPTETSQIAPVFNVQSNQPSEEGQITHTWTISPTMVNNVVVSLSWYSTIFTSPDISAALAAFPVNLFITDGGSNGAGGFTQMGLGRGGAGFNFFPQGRNVGQGQITDDFSIVRGRHIMKFGVNYRRDRVTDTSLEQGIYGQYNFSSLTAFSTGQLTNGTNPGSNYAQTFPAFDAAYIRYNSLGLYGQDEWSVRPNLKITFGVRFDSNPDPSCANACFSRLNNQFSSAAFAKGVAIPYDQSIETGLSSAFASTQFGVVQPRVGIVYSPKNTHGMVVRAGFGMFSDLAPAALSYNIFTNAPNEFSAPVLSGSVNAANDPTSAAALALAGAQAFSAGFAHGYTFTQLNNALSAIGGFSPPSFFSSANHMLAPKFLEYSFEIQEPLDRKDVLDVTYSGNHGRDLLTVNPAVNAFGFSTLPAAAPDPRFSTVQELTNGGISNYNGLTVAVRRALGYGFHGEIGYTWSHSLDDISSQLGEPYNDTINNESQTVLNTPFSPKFNYGNSDYDIRQNLTADFLWDLPFKPSNRLLKEVLGGWTASSRFYVRTGVPFSVFDFNEAAALLANDIAPVNYNGFLATALPGTSQNCGTGGVNNACFTTANFVASGSETGFGNLPRNAFRGPGFFDWDATLYKSFTVRENYRFTIGASAYNLTNHPNFDTPSANISSPGLGLINNTVSLPTSAYGAAQGSATSARLVVLAAKFQFWYAEILTTEILEPLNITSWQGPFPPEVIIQAADALETGKLLYAPRLPFELSDAEHRFLSPNYLGTSKNVSFRPHSGELRGTDCQGSEREELLGMLQRYHRLASDLLKALCPAYGNRLTPGFTSFRPAEIAGRTTSWRHDDTRLHVDAFPSRPMQGLRILRVFTNVNPKAPRIWRVGETFEQAAARFLPGIRPPLPGTSWLLEQLRIVKGRRTEYDHFMLEIHDRMKADQGYQAQVPQTQLAIPPGATWACFTDSVSHAATSGQFAFEQTFYLPVSAMKDPERSPLRVLERLTGRALT